MVYLQGVPDAVDGVFLPARLEIAAKNLQNAEALQPFQFRAEDQGCKVATKEGQNGGRGALVAGSLSGFHNYNSQFQAVGLFGLLYCLGRRPERRVGGAYCAGRGK